MARRFWFFQRLLLLSVRQLRRDHMINTIGLEEERGRAPNLSVEQGRNLFRLGTGRDATFQSSLVT